MKRRRTGIDRRSRDRRKREVTKETQTKRLRNEKETEGDMSDTECIPRACSSHATKPKNSLCKKCEVSKGDEV
jgi:hypothetical protein